jgi:hypothetical protein
LLVGGDPSQALGLLGAGAIHARVERLTPHASKEAPTLARVRQRVGTCTSRSRGPIHTRPTVKASVVSCLLAADASSLDSCLLRTHFVRPEIVGTRATRIASAMVRIVDGLARLHVDLLDEQAVFRSLVVRSSGLVILQSEGINLYENGYFLLLQTF